MSLIKTIFITIKKLMKEKNFRRSGQGNFFRVHRQQISDKLQVTFKGFCLSAIPVKESSLIAINIALNFASVNEPYQNSFYFH